MRCGLRWMMAGAMLLPLAAGCKHQAAGPKGGAEQEAAKPAGPSGPSGEARTPVDQATAGGVSGMVRFQGKAPERVKIDMSMDPVCEMTAGENFSEQYMVKDGKLENVYVYVKSGPEAAMHAAPVSVASVVMDQKGCRYTPHVVAVMEGGQVEFRNSDSTMHNVHTLPQVTGNATIDVSQGPKGTPEVRRFDQPETMLPVRCNNHPWMNAFVNVAATPFYAVTGPDGKFELTGLPAGTYVLAAVQEKMGEQIVQVTVRPHEKSTADFSFSKTQ